METAWPFTTLFLGASADGKTSTGDTEEMDVDRDFLTIAGVNQGLNQYYDLELGTDEFSLTKGKTLAKTGINQQSER